MDRLKRGGNAKLVPYDKWGPEKNIELIKDADGNVVGSISDEMRFITEPDIRKVTKRDVLEDIDAWRGDDGYYGDEDTAIYFAYSDGTFVTAEDLDGKKYKKAGLIGVSISTGDYQMVWGGELNKRTGQIVPWRTTEFDDESNPVEGYSNSYSGYKSTGMYRVRVRQTTVPNGKGGWKTKREIIRRSEVKPINV